MNDDWILSATRLDQETRGKIRTFTGRYVNPLALTTDDICIEDIAHHLAGVNRYTGATPVPYSVAQHSYLVSEYFDGTSPWLQMAALLHDASEAYLNDIASPVKHDPRFAFYRDAERAVTFTIFAKFGILDFRHELERGGEIKHFDDRVFGRECESFWGGESDIVPWSAATAELTFLDRYYRIKELMHHV